VFLQLPAESNFSAVLAAGAVISQYEVGMAAVQYGQLAERVGHGLVWPGHLQGTHLLVEYIQYIYSYIYFYTYMYFTWHIMSIEGSLLYHQV